jgi:hypothetical protein
MYSVTAFISCLEELFVVLLKVDQDHKACKPTHRVVCQQSGLCRMYFNFGPAHCVVNNIIAE